MSIFYMAASDSTGKERCKATTVGLAKREATRRFSTQYVSSAASDVYKRQVRMAKTPRSLALRLAKLRGLAALVSFAV